MDMNSIFVKNYISGIWTAGLLQTNSCNSFYFMKFAPNEGNRI